MFGNKQGIGYTKGARTIQVRAPLGFRAILWDDPIEWGLHTFRTVDTQKGHTALHDLSYIGRQDQAEALQVLVLLAKDREVVIELVVFLN